MVVNEEVPEHYFVMSTLSTPINSSEGLGTKATIFSPELVDCKFKPSDLPHLSDAQLDTLKKLCLELADVLVLITRLVSWHQSSAFQSLRLC